jgi:hypothetical protein
MWPERLIAFHALPQALILPCRDQLAAMYKKFPVMNLEAVLDALHAPAGA